MCVAPLQRRWHAAWTVTCFAAAVFLSSSPAVAANNDVFDTVQQWYPFEVELHASQHYDNPYTDVELHVVFTLRNRVGAEEDTHCLLYTSPSPRDRG